MKTNLRTITLLLATIVCFATHGGASRAAEAVTEDLGCYVEQGNSVKIVRVFAVTPIYVLVILEGQAGRKIPRNELPPQLAAKYPYDAEKAAAYRAQQVMFAAQQVAAQQAAQQAGIRQRLSVIDAEMDQLVKQDTSLQGEVNIYHHMPWGNGRKVRLAHLLDQQQSIREQLLRLRQQRAALTARL